MNDHPYYFFYLALSGIFLGILFVLSLVFEKVWKFSPEIGRKIIHILFANWYFIPYFMLPDAKDILMTIVPPLIFTALNFLSYRYKIVRLIERDNPFDFGTIVYPLSFAILLVIFTYWLKMPYIGLFSALVLGYGDGLAGLVGRYFSHDKNHKSSYGFLTMGIVTFLISAIFILIFQNYQYFYFALVIAPIAAVLEYFGPHGTDNVTVPLGVGFLYYLLLIIL